MGCNWLPKQTEKVQIGDVVSDIKESITEFNGNNVTEIGNAIGNNIKLMNDLTNYINKSKNYEEAFPHIVTTVNRLARSYRGISDKKEVIRTTLNNKIADIRKQQEVAKEKIKYIENKIRTSENELSSEHVDYRKTSLEMTIKFQKQEKEVWVRFVSGVRFNELLTKLTSASDGINKFIDILDANTKVYEAAATTLSAVQSYKNASKELQEVLNVVELGDELVDSWNKLSLIIDGAIDNIDNVEKIDFTKPTKTDSTEVTK